VGVPGPGGKSHRSDPDFKQVCSILEGGETAFENRKKKILDFIEKLDQAN